MLRARLASLVAPASLGLLFALACCATSPTVEPTPEPGPSLGPPACVRAWDGSDRFAVLQPWVEGDRIHFCLGSPYAEGAPEEVIPACFVVDMTSGSYHADEALHPDAAPSLPRIEIQGETVKVCPRADEGDCRSVKVGNIPAEAPLERWDVSVNARGDRLVVAVGVQELEERYAQVYDLGTGEMTARFKIAEGSYLCQTPQWLGETLVIHGNVCAGPGGVSWSVDPATGARGFTVGADGAEVNTYGAGPIHTRGDLWAFLDAFAAEVVLMDVKAGKAVGSLQLKSYFPQNGSPNMENQAASVAFGEGNVAVILPDEAAGVIVVMDGATGKLLSERRPTLCPP